MFRVDPQSKVVPFGARSVEDYGFLQLTRNAPIWLLQVESGEGPDTQRGLRYLFEDVGDVANVGAYRQWTASRIYVLLPDPELIGGPISMSAVREIWACRISKRHARGLCYRVVTDESEFHLHDIDPSSATKEAYERLWPPAIE